MAAAAAAAVAWVPVRILFLAAVAASAAEALSLDVHHRYSATVREWVGHRAPPAGTAEYYAALAGHDLRRRSLASGSGAGGEVAFADGNDTYRLNDFGFLHYAVVALGTPNVTFLVALDTGSDLFWVPCDCIKCAPLVSPNYGVRTASPTSSTICLLLSWIIPLLVADNICGQVQTGSFLGSAAPNGLLGLGMDSKSVPSLLASDGVAPNSFSMCFGEDGHGRINFGDTGGSDQQETPLNIYKQNPYYNISITGAMVGSKSINARFSAIVDSGTSFTALSDPMYTEITRSFNSQVQDKPSQLDSSSLPFEFCYSVSSKGTINPPNISLTAKGGSIFPVNDPIITITDTASNPIGYCLAMMKSEGVNLIGENFMSGLKIVFDRERKVLGWKNFDCYSVDSSSNLPVNSNSSAVPPKPAMGPNSYTPEATKGASPNGNQVNVLQPSASSSPKLHFNISVFITAALLFIAIL
nr:unnamed protein product [Digitaria exilis]